MRKRGHNSGLMWVICKGGTGERTREPPAWKRPVSLSPVGFRHFWLERPFCDVRQEGEAYGKRACFLSSAQLSAPSFHRFC